MAGWNAFCELIIIPEFILCQRINLTGLRENSSRSLDDTPACPADRQAGILKEDDTDFLLGKLEAEQKAPVDNGVIGDIKGVPRKQHP